MPDRARIIARLIHLALETHERPGLAVGALAAVRHLRENNVELARQALLRSPSSQIMAVAWDIRNYMRQHGIASGEQLPDDTPPAE